MKNKFLLFLSFIFVAFVFTGCISRPADSLVFSEVVNGCTVNIDQGEVFKIQLKENPTTGYIWTIDKIDTNMLSVANVEFKADNENLVGSGGVRDMKIKTLNPGKTKLKLVLSRPWEKNVEPSKTFELDLNIKPD